MAGQKRKDATQSSKQPSKMPRRAPSKMKKKDSTSDTQLCNQDASVLFRLPREIRDIIYREIFVFPVTVHLAYVGTSRIRKFRSFLCKLSKDEQPEKRPQPLCPRCRVNHHRCSPRKGTSDDVVGRPSPEVQTQARALALLLSCRRVHDETAEMLYRENTFYIENPRTLLELPSALSQAQLSSFRHLYLESARYGENTPADRLDKWAAVVAVLERLDGLETLVVILRPMFGLEWEVEELVKPLEAAGLPTLRDPPENAPQTPTITAKRPMGRADGSAGPAIGAVRKRPDAMEENHAFAAGTTSLASIRRRNRCDASIPLEEHQAYLITGLRKLYESIQQDAKLPEVDRDGNNRPIVHELLDKLGIFEEPMKEHKPTMTGSKADAKPSLRRLNGNDIMGGAITRLPESSRAWSSTQEVKPSLASNPKPAVNLPRALTLPNHIPLNTGMAQQRGARQCHGQAGAAGLKRQRPVALSNGFWRWSFDFSDFLAVSSRDGL
ncbi:hypothetical protein Asppvi_009453 [Aspergillus pseudoviridinutans]|uniref:DUF7730 domain-containing protein n=1 Tax=Aspergillus pseudoviridinutans TaxID=1517512 RepID=A0A9P3BLG5_9EURO|nr:uncharacterized protein Asppvi_009453 [Aspergillus pseudoviridinutans]GIJ90498.1 hypothetical protein Asppvi_009453 [Aspergillus pseudoviridinutans]